VSNEFNNSRRIKILSSSLELPVGSAVLLTAAVLFLLFLLLPNHGSRPARIGWLAAFLAHEAAREQ
jgi:hypothetical protein